MAPVKKDKPAKAPAKAKQVQYYEGIGRRREAVARVRLYLTGREKVVTVEGSKIKAGEFLINKKPIEQVFASTSHKVRYMAPFKLTGTEDRFAVSVHLAGGGNHGQLEAMILGISRAIESTDKEVIRPILKPEGLLTRNPRIRERRKVGTGGKARRQKQSPKR